MKETPKKFIFKIIVIGDGAVGKTSLINRFTQGGFQDDYIPTIGAQFSVYKQKINDDECVLFLWDIAGQDSFHFLRPAFYKESKGVIIVYSLEENDLGVKSLNNVKNWHNEIKKFCGDIPVIIFANKVDLINKNEIDNKKVNKILNKKKFIAVYQTSAKTGENVDDAFKTIIKLLYDKYK